MDKLSNALIDRVGQLGDNINNFHYVHSRFGNFHKQHTYPQRYEEAWRGKHMHGSSNHRRKFQGMICISSSHHPRITLQYIAHIEHHCSWDDQQDRRRLNSLVIDKIFSASYTLLRLVMPVGISWARIAFPINI